MDTRVTTARPQLYNGMLSTKHMKGREFSWNRATYVIDGRIQEQNGGVITLRITTDNAGAWPDELTVLGWLKEMFGSEMAIVGTPSTTHARQRLYRVERL